MRFTVLGVSGFIGSHLVKHLCDAGHECFTPARSDRIEPECELGHVIYCIGLTADFRRRPFDTIRAHVSHLADVLEYSRFDSLLYLSSTRVYQGSRDTGEDAPLAVNPCNPGDLYNLSKLAGEALCLSCGREAVRVARLSNVVGGRLSSEHFLSQLLRAALDDGRIELQTSLKSAKDYIGIRDVVEILPVIALSGQHRIYNVASGQNLSNRAVVDAMKRHTGCKVALSKGAEAITFAPIVIHRLREEFGFRATSPSRCLEEWIGNVKSLKRTTL